MNFASRRRTTLSVLAKAASPATPDMKTLARRWAAKIGWRLPLSRLLSERRPVVLTYHGIPAQGLPDEVDARAFERQMLFLKTHFDLVSMDSLAMCGRSLRSRVQVLLTFDDGFRNKAEVVAPILRRNGIPAVFSSARAMRCLDGIYGSVI